MRKLKEKIEMILDNKKISIHKPVFQRIKCKDLSEDTVEYEGDNCSPVCWVMKS